MEQTNATNEAPKRPVFLTVLCILSFIAAGFGILAYVAAITLASAASAAVSSLSSSDSAELSAAMSSYSGPSVGMIWAYVIVGFVTTLVGLFGVIKMWKLQKIGFFLYTGASVISMVMGIIFSGFSVMAVIFPIAFIVMYGLNLKHLK